MSGGPFARGVRAARPERDQVAAREWVYVPYDRLTAEVGPLAGADPGRVGAIFVESRQKAARRPYHKQKLALLLSNERHFALELAARGFKLLYLTSDRPIGEALAEACRARGIARVRTTRPAERELRQDLAQARALGLDVREEPDPTWLTTPEEFAAAFPRGGPWRLDTFYRRARRARGWLMEHGRPLGGRFSLDEENRRPWTGEPAPPERPRFAPDALTREVLELVEREFPAHFGRLDGFDHPCSAADAERAWAFARAQLLPLFGPFEDAMSRRAPDLFHTRLSALLNLGRLLPARLIGDTLADHAAGRVPLASAEGFVRQLLGWREMVRHVHEATDGYRTLEPAGAPNALEATRSLPAAYWGEPSGLACLDAVVEQVLGEGYSHHITRLMVLGNLATLLGVSPRELTDWFWFAYVDAFDWVVEPNVLSMATWADGGLLTTKPYVCGSAYLQRMGREHCQACALDPRRATGPGSCPFTALYWTFLARNAERLGDNQRLRLPLASLRKKSPAELRALAERAEQARLALSEARPIS